MTPKAQRRRSELAAEAHAVLRRIWRGRHVCIVAQYFDAFFEATVAQLSAAGAKVAGAIAARSDAALTATLPFPVFELEKAGLLEGNAPWEPLLMEPPRALRDWLETIDPQRRACFLGSQFTGTGVVDGRRVIGWRREDWARWEDKTEVAARIEGLVPMPRGRVVDSNDTSALARAFAEHETPFGIVAASSSAFDRGGSSALKVVRSLSELEAFAKASRGASIRISAFTKGVPCSVIGMVLNGDVLVFDPIEIVTLFDRGKSRFLFCGSSSLWRPEREVAEEIRSAARRVGQAMVRRSGFRGGFSLDGILTTHGFRATEVNARNASGLRLRYLWPEFPSYLFVRSIVEDGPECAGLDGRALEAEIRALTLERPSFSVVVPKARDAAGEGEAAFGGGRGAMRLRYAASPGGAGVRILSADLPSKDKLLCGAVQSLAAHIGRPDLVTPALL